jgi:integrase
VTGRRAAAGESSISKGTDGRWHDCVSMGMKRDGRRDRRHVSGARRADVVAKVRALEQQRDSGVVQAAGKAPTVGQWLDHWLDTIAARKVRPRTLEGYRSKVCHHLAPGLGHHRLDRLQPEQVDAFYTECLAVGMAPASVLQCHRILSRALKVAMQRGKVTRNVCTLVDAPSLEQSEVDPLSRAEARKLLAVASTLRNGARWSVALALGLRQGEALGLAWDDIDLDTGALTVRRALQRQKGRGLVMVEPKSRAGRRSIVLPVELHEALRVHRTAQTEERLAAGPLWEDHGLVFAQRNGRPIDPRRDWGQWKELLHAAGVRDARLHDARHTAATLLMTQGVPPRVAMQVLGHSQISLTLGTYSHVVPELAQDAADGMSAALWGPEATTLAPGTRRRRASSP